MGGFYGSIHVRTGDRRGVLAAAKKVAEDLKAKFLVSPQRGEWVSIYPSGHGQDPTVSEALARALPSSIIHLLVHDDDIFAYWFYRDGALVDEYNSCPNYFKDVTAAERARTAGKPELIADLFHGAAAALDKARKILTAARSRKVSFASESMSQFAELLGIADTATAFEYLSDGETDDIEDFAKFTHVPSRAPERRREMARAKKTSEEKRLLIEQGLLLGEWASPPISGRWKIPAFPRWCADATGGFLL